MRAFLAVELSADLHARLVAVQHELARHRAAVRWARDDQLHVTLKFLGNVEEAALGELRQVLSPALRAAPPLAAEVRGLGTFPDLRRPRIVWAGVECAPLAGIAAAADAAAATIGVVPETRPFHAHVTLGRVNGSARWAPLGREIVARASEDFGACTFSELVAFRSDLRPDGALYTKLWSIPFGG
ncbi:MAG TPA: RNA 2',3'-cyclic phosphodiesterase [Candidatus Dormibacteraeota bacterium]|nr:RNA 2',3'-cyclic phosphodiesterase [Candidatus Dormibacteraeota bacterium]